MISVCGFPARGKAGRFAAMKKIFALFLCAALPAFGKGGHFDFRSYEKNPPEWFRSAEGSNVLANVLSHQSALGGWPKNTDTAKKPSVETPEEIHGTFDNGATTGEIRLMAMAFNATGEARFRESAQRGIDLILKAQYPTGGWPQSYPPDKQYHRYITFNDDAMTRLLDLLREISASNNFAFVEGARREAAKKSFDRGIECILKCQIRVNGKLTVWCAQHDEITLEPREGRKFELVSLSGGESCGVLLLLMSIENPSPEIIRAVHAGAAWYENAKITGIKQVVENGDKKIEKDENAPPVWARFYEIETGRPIFSDRDSVKKYDMAEIGHERRNGYSWYGSWGEKVEKRFAEWSKSHPQG